MVGDDPRTDSSSIAENARLGFESLRIPTDITGRIIENAALRFPFEACGVVAGYGNLVQFFWPCRNRSSDPSNRYEIDAADLMSCHQRASRLGQRVLGYMHSHPDSTAELSDTDRDSWNFGDEYAMLIVGFKDYIELKAWNVPEHELIPILLHK